MNVIFSYSNNKVNNELQWYQEQVVNKFKGDILYFYKLYDGDLATTVDTEITNFFNNGIKNILILDIDCIPLSSYAIEYSFQQAEKNILIGNIQRANHINNNAHLYVSPSSMCFSKDLYFSLDCPSFASTHKGDIGEEFTYRAENNIEYYYPSHFEQQPTNKKGIIQNAWELNEALPTYGIGTTYSLNDIDMYYHLFQSRYGTHNQLFYNRCNKLLNDNR